MKKDSCYYYEPVDNIGETIDFCSLTGMYGRCPEDHENCINYIFKDDVTKLIEKTYDKNPDVWCRTTYLSKDEIEFLNGIIKERRE